MKHCIGLALFACALGFVGVAAAETPVASNTETEDLYLDILPKIDIPANVVPIPGAVNVEFRNCKALWPTEYGASQNGPEARAYRDIYGYVKVRNVIQTQDCSCIGKVASWSDVEALATKIRDLNGFQSLGWIHTEIVFKQSGPLFPVAEKMCAGKF